MVGTASPYLSVSRGDFVQRGIAAGVNRRHSREVGIGQAVLGKEVGDGSTEGRIAVDQGVVEVQQ